MDKNLLLKSELFMNISGEELSGLLSCLRAREKCYEKGEIVLHSGEKVHELGFVEAGSVNITLNFYWGQSHIIGHIERGNIFAESYALLSDKELKADVVVAENARIIFFDMRGLLNICKNSCASHQQMLKNLLMMSARKNLALSSRMLHTAPKTIRERLLSYLSQMAIEKGSDEFVIPFSRQELADYLALDRSTLSNELSKMRRDGFIDFKKNLFWLKNKRGL